MSNVRLSGFPFQAQKPWAKKYEKVMKAKDEFHKACKSLRTAEINERNQQADTSISEDQVSNSFLIFLKSKQQLFHYLR